MNLAADLQAYVSGRRDSKQEQALLRRIRALPQPQRMEILAPLLNLKGRAVALLLVDHAQLSRADYRAILRRGLAEADASSIQSWLKATVAHLGWRTVTSEFRESFKTNPRGVAFALYHVPYLFFDYYKPSPELHLELLRLIVACHENGYRAVTEGDLDRIKKALWDRNHLGRDDANAFSVEFELSWEDWLDSRDIQNVDAKTLKQFRADYLRFGAERRLFSANTYGWRYTDSSGTARHDWSELIGVAYREHVIVLMSTGCHYPLPRSAFNKSQLDSLSNWLKTAMK